MKYNNKKFAEIEKIITDKTSACANEIYYMLNRMQAMFKYSGLPESIPAAELELQLQMYGDSFLTSVGSKFYALHGHACAEYDEYDNPTEYFVTNTALNISQAFKIDVDGVWIKNDTFGVGIIPLLRKYCALLVENHISIRQAIINARALSIISANDDKTKASADIFLRKLVDGELSAIGEQPFFDGIKSFDVSTGLPLRQLLETEQYLKASMFHELGIDYNPNLKRTVISSFEAQLNDDFLLPLVDNFYENRKLALHKFNQMFNLSTDVQFNSTWLTNQLENQREQEIFQQPLPESESESKSEISYIPNAGGDTSDKIQG